MNLSHLVNRNALGSVQHAEEKRRYQFAARASYLFAAAAAAVLGFGPQNQGGAAPFMTVTEIGVQVSKIGTPLSIYHP